MANWKVFRRRQLSEKPQAYPVTACYGERPRYHAEVQLLLMSTYLYAYKLMQN